MKKGIAAAVVVVAIAGAAVFWIRSRQGDSSVLDLSGTVETREIQVGSKVGGRVTEVLVEEGQQVHKGMPLIRFGVDELLAQRDQLRGRVAEAAAQAARLQAGYRPEEIQQAEAATKRELASLQELQHGSRPQEIAQAQADYEAAKADTANAVATLARLEKLHASGDVSTQSRDDARTRQEQLVKREEAARQRLLLVQAGARQEEIRAAEQRYRSAQSA